MAGALGICSGVDTCPLNPLRGQHDHLQKHRNAQLFRNQLLKGPDRRVRDPRVRRESAPANGMQPFSLPEVGPIRNPRSGATPVPFGTTAEVDVRADNIWGYFSPRGGTEPLRIWTPSAPSQKFQAAWIAAASPAACRLPIWKAWMARFGSIMFAGASMSLKSGSTATSRLVWRKWCQFSVRGDGGGKRATPSGALGPEGVAGQDHQNVGRRRRRGVQVTEEAAVHISGGP